MSNPQPSVGRHVHFFPGASELGQMVRLDAQPLHAVVLFVHNESRLNLEIVDHHGNRHFRPSVLLVTPDSERPADSHAAWMPYQVAQAAAPAGEPSEGNSIETDTASVIAATPAPAPAPTTGTEEA